jgi:hypothetical protein
LQGLALAQAKANPIGEGTMAALEAPDTPISMRRAGELAGLDPATLKQAAQGGRLAATKPGHDWLTTRRQLDEYLRARRKSNAAPLPNNYVPVAQDDNAGIGTVTVHGVFDE